ncbi:class I SAM-dependent methyltransferase [Magnetospirillum moscoviense]|uniref:Methyltransferase domain-containing protein n=1 Tax=Magnetospirillum moscoviense TaxID=1437059 RepID=A0A178MB62_9PROT|nr:class I SAM-dependent methyltransferase [Magnetospirillum moscoviense]MBF0324296.1 class I SAM-dependent methyltransferase [Alphaproteobacteria bacterium]OAN45377.1 hypothetical protein A6A05_04460 [Magnetospirillum moscoviense]
MTGTDFDRHAGDYRHEVNESLSGFGTDIDRLADSKAALIGEVLGGDRLARARVLDVGCGIGLICRRLIDRVAQMHGTDISAASLEQAAKACPRGHFQAYDGVTFPYPDATFDLVFAVNVFHHIPVAARPAMAAEMARVAAFDGFVLIVEHNPANPVTRRIVDSCPLDDGAILLKAAESRALLSGAGLAGVSTRYFGFVPWRGPMVDRWEGLLARLPLGAQYLCRAAKPQCWRSPANGLS